MARSPSSPGLPPQRDDTGTRILDAAVAAFSSYGFRRAAVEDVARAAGVAKGTIYLYHESKEALFRAVVARVAGEVLARAEAAGLLEAPTADRIRLVLEAKFVYLYDVVTRSPHAADLIESQGRLAADLFEAADRKYQALLAAVLSEGVGEGTLDLAAAGLSPATAAAFLVRIGHGLDTPDATGAVPSRDVYRKRIAEMVRVALIGLARR